MAVLESAIFWIIVAAASEIIALTPLKSNSVIQLVLSALNAIKPAKKAWTFLTMASGYGDLTPVLIGSGFNVTYERKNFIQLCLIN